MSFLSFILYAMHKELPKDRNLGNFSEKNFA